MVNGDDDMHGQKEWERQAWSYVQEVSGQELHDLCGRLRVPKDASLFSRYRAHMNTEESCQLKDLYKNCVAKCGRIPKVWFIKPVHNLRRPNDMEFVQTRDVVLEARRSGRQEPQHGRDAVRAAPIGGVGARDVMCKASNDDGSR